MNLHEVLGLGAVGIGVGCSYGIAVPHSLAAWASLLVGSVVGILAYVVLRRATAQFQSERALAAMYVVTFIGTLAATVAGAWLVRLSVNA